MSFNLQAKQSWSTFNSTKNSSNVITMEDLANASKTIVTIEFVRSEIVLTSVYFEIILNSLSRSLEVVSVDD